MSELIKFEKCYFEKTGLKIDESVTFEEWEELGKALQKAGGAIQFWIGDWIRFGENHWGEKYAQAIELTGLEYGTLSTDKYVADKVDLSLRNENLTFQHHKEVASLESDQQKILLDMAEKEKLTTRQLRDEVRKIKAPSQSIPLPKGKFEVIYADPPWRYEFSSDTKDDIENKYPTMELEEIKSMDIPSADNSVLLMWATAPKTEEAIEVLNAWGFKYRTNAVWDKEWIGMGYWFRGQHELLLVGVKGNFSPPESTERVSSVIRERRTEHSKKPECVYGMIEKMFPDRKYLELFARNNRDNWTGFGNEIK